MDRRSRNPGAFDARPRLKLVSRSATAPAAADELQALFQQYGRALHLFVLAIVKCEQTARELSQDACLRVLQKHRAGDIQHARAYLFQTAANVARDHLRRQSVCAQVFDPRAEVDPDVSYSDAPSPEEEAILRQTEARLATAMAAMSPKTRQVFYYRRFETHSIASICALMKISETMVYKHLRRALRRLAEAFPGESPDGRRRG